MKLWIIQSTGVWQGMALILIIGFPTLNGHVKLLFDIVFHIICLSDYFRLKTLLIIPIFAAIKNLNSMD